MNSSSRYSDIDDLLLSDARRVERPRDPCLDALSRLAQADQRAQREAEPVALRPSDAIRTPLADNFESPQRTPEEAAFEKALDDLERFVDQRRQGQDAVPSAGRRLFTRIKLTRS